MEKKYTGIKNRYLAETLAFFGMKYMKFNNPEGTIYSFEETEKFKEVLARVLKFREDLKNI